MITRTSVLALVAILVLFPTRPTSTTSHVLSDDGASEDAIQQVNSIPSHDIEIRDDSETQHSDQDDNLLSDIMKDEPHVLEDETVLPEDEDIGSLCTEQVETMEKGAAEVPLDYHNVPLMTTVDESEVVSDHSGGDGSHGLPDSEGVRLATDGANVELHEREGDGEGEREGKGEREGDGEREGEAEREEGEVEESSAGEVATDPPVALQEPPTAPTTEIPEYDLVDPIPPQGAGTPSTTATQGLESTGDHLPPEDMGYTDVPNEVQSMLESEATPPEVLAGEGVEEADDVPTFTEFSQRKRLEQDSSSKLPPGTSQ